MNLQLHILSIFIRLFCSNNPKGKLLALLRIDVMYVGSWVRPPRTATRMTLRCTSHNCILGGGYVAYISWAFPAATSNGHHQDYYDSRRGPYKPSFSTVTGRGKPNIYLYIYTCIYNINSLSYIIYTPKFYSSSLKKYMYIYIYRTGR